MTNEQIRQLQDLSKCYMRPREARWVKVSLDWSDDPGISMTKWDKADLRRLTHQYRNQIRAIKRNQRNNEIKDMMAISESVLAKEWNRPEEDEAWKYLREMAAG